MTLRFRPFEPRDVATLTTWFASEAEVVAWGGRSLDHPLDASHVEQMLGETRTRPPRRLCWTATDGDRLVGHAQCAFDWRNGVATLARVAIAPDARGRGLARPLSRHVLESAFDHATIQRIELNVFTFNTSAIRAYERLGFQHEGVRRSSTQVGTERWSTAIMSMLRSEFEERPRTEDVGQQPRQC